MFRFFALILAFVFSLIATAQAEKKALIIAIGAYDKAATGWSPISSANDVPLVTAALESQGFLPQNIVVLQDEAATKLAIVAALNALAQNTKAGDVIVVHYSGHGQQITDDNGDEVDGLDEAIVPVDAHANYQKGIYEGENHLRDDELGKILDNIRKKAGKKGSVLLIMDSCHSGTASRGYAVARGAANAFEVPQSGLANQSNANYEPEALGLFGFDANESLNRAPLVCIYGASAHELNYETKTKDGVGVGSLSLAFSDAFASAKSNQSYEELFDQIKLKMSVLAPRQSPQLEGDTKLGILGGNIAGKKDYFAVSSSGTSGVVVIAGGSLMGVLENSEISFYALGAIVSPENLITTGIVTFADATTADVKIADVQKTNLLVGAKAVMSKVNYGAMLVTVSFKIGNATLQKLIEKDFAQYGFINVVPTGAALMVEQTANNKIQLITGQEYVLFAADMTDTAAISKNLAKQVLAYAQANYLRKIEMYNEDLDVNFAFIPVSATPTDRRVYQETARFGIDTKTDAAGNITFHKGDFAKVSVTNNGYQVAYITLLDFQPDNVINVLLPERSRQPADYALQPGETREFLLLQFADPYGIEVFKLIATAQPVDFRNILVNKGNTRGQEASNPFAQLMTDSFKENGGTRGGETMSVSPGNSNIYTVTFKIAPAK